MNVIWTRKVIPEFVHTFLLSAKYSCPTISPLKTGWRHVGVQKFCAQLLRMCTVQGDQLSSKWVKTQPVFLSLSLVSGVGLSPAGVRVLFLNLLKLATEG